MPPELPDFIPPMLAQKGEPFDSDAHLFEIKWDGTRAQVRLPGDGSYLLTNRRQRDLTARYPEFDFLGELDAGAGIILDAEIVVLQDGKPHFGSMLKREQGRDDRRIHNLSRALPATLVVFDILYRDGQSVMGESFARRRELLREFVENIEQPRMLLSEGVVGGGKEYFAAATAQQLEGVMAKRLASPYQPGRRTDDWLKIKQEHRLQCAILGYRRGGPRHPQPGDRRAGPHRSGSRVAVERPLRCVGRVGSGLSAARCASASPSCSTRAAATRRSLPCEEDGLWVEPGLYCIVSYLELTRVGHLRAPVFLDLIVDP